MQKVIHGARYFLNKDNVDFKVTEYSHENTDTFEDDEITIKPVTIYPGRLRPIRNTKLAPHIFKMIFKHTEYFHKSFLGMMYILKEDSWLKNGKRGEVLNCHSVPVRKSTNDCSIKYSEDF